MNNIRKTTVQISLVLVASFLFAAGVMASGGGSLWLIAGYDRENTRYQKTESKIAAENVASLTPRWIFTTGGDVSATPAVDGDAVYFPDFAGNLFKLDRDTGAVIWQSSIPALTNIPGNFARATPAIDDGKLFVGDQGGRSLNGARMMAFDTDTGGLLWTTQVSDHPAALVTQSAAVFDGVVYVGVSSFEETLAAIVAGYDCCTFRGSLLALDADTGQIIWQTFLAPEGYSGNGIWGGMPVIDTKRNALYVATGNNYSAPDDFLNCIKATVGDTDAQFACVDPENHFDSVISLDMATGAINWAARTIPYDVWTCACLYGLPDCPDPAGDAYDFAQAPILYKNKDAKRDLLGIGQKSGQFWALDADNGQIVWVTQVGPGGEFGGLMWGSAYDGERIYTAVANSRQASWTLLDGASTTGGFWSALDPTTGQILWQTVDPADDWLWSPTTGALTAANGLVFGCSMDSDGHMYALDGTTGSILWSFASGGSCSAGAAVVNGTVYWGSGYSSMGTGTPNNKFYSFTLP